MKQVSRLIILALLFNAAIAYGHSGDKVDQGIWHKKVLIVKWDSNWPTEHCLDVLEPLKLKYAWSSEHAMKYDFHVHPTTENNEYQTDYFSKSDSISKEVGEIITKKPGPYCFNFFPVTSLFKNSSINLKYRLN
mgnify:CR=1 FL=1